MGEDKQLQGGGGGGARLPGPRSDGTGSGLDYRVRYGFEPEVVGPFTTL